MSWRIRLPVLDRMLPHRWLTPYLQNPMQSLTGPGPQNWRLTFTFFRWVKESSIPSNDHSLPMPLCL